MERLGDRTVFWLPRLWHVTESLCGLRVYQLGNGFVEQSEGIPIGDPTSGAVRDMSLGHLVEMFDIAHRNSWKAIANNNLPRHESNACARFADDIYVISKWF